MGPPPRLVTPVFALLWAATFCVFLSFYLLLPVLPVYALRLGIRESGVGLVIGVFALASMLWKPWAGWALDWRGRRPILRAGGALFALASLAYPWARSATSLLVVRLVHGTGMGFFPTASAAMVADLAPAARRGEAMGLFGMAANLALALGPALGDAIEARRGFAAVCVVSLALATFGTALALGVPETGRPAARPPFRLRGLLARQALYPAAITFLLFLHYGTLMGFLPLLARARGVDNPGLFFTLMAAGLLAVRTKAGQLSDRYGRGAVVAPALVVVAASLAVVAGAYTPWALYGAGLLFGLGFGSAQPVLMAWAADLVGPADRGRAVATFYTAWELGIGGGQILFGLLLPLGGFEGLFGAGSALALVASALAFRRRTPAPACLPAPGEYHRGGGPS
jgi:MFS family permease